MMIFAAMEEHAINAGFMEELFLPATVLFILLERSVKKVPQDFCIHFFTLFSLYLK